MVGQDRPSGPDLMAFVALESRSVHGVAAVEVTDPSLGAGSVTLQSSLGAPAACLLTDGDGYSLGREVAVVERLAGRARVEPAVQRDLALRPTARRVSALSWRPIDRARSRTRRWRSLTSAARLIRQNRQHHHQLRIAKHRVQLREVCRQLAHLDRQRLVAQVPPAPPTASAHTPPRSIRNPLTCRQSRPSTRTTTDPDQPSNTNVSAETFFRGK